MGTCTSRPSPDPPDPIPLPRVSQPSPHPPASYSPSVAVAVAPARKSSEPSTISTSLSTSLPRHKPSKPSIDDRPQKRRGGSAPPLTAPAHPSRGTWVMSNGTTPSEREIEAKTRRLLELGGMGLMTDDQGRMEVKILLLGSGESGKSTILKQMKILHGGGFTPGELAQYREIIRHNLVDSAQALLRVVLQWGYRPELGEGPGGEPGSPDVEDGWESEEGEGEGEEGEEEEEEMMSHLPRSAGFSVPISLAEQQRAPAAPAAPPPLQPTPQPQQEGDEPRLSFQDMLRPDVPVPRERGGSWQSGVSGDSGGGKQRWWSSKSTKGSDPPSVLAASPPRPTPAPARPTQAAAAYASPVRGNRSLLSISESSSRSSIEEQRRREREGDAEGEGEKTAEPASPSTSTFTPRGSDASYLHPALLPPSTTPVPLPLTTTTTTTTRPRRRKPRPQPDPSTSPTARALLAFRLDPINGGQRAVPGWVVDAVDRLWGSEFMKDVMRRSAEFYLMDNAPYFFKHARRICAERYVPTNQDVLRSRVQTRGVTESRFVVNQLHIHVFDVGGQREERKKWIYAFEKVRCVIFTVALSEYDQTLLEVPGQNRMQESLKLFEGVLASRWFQTTSFIIFFNKMDLFEEKIKRSPLKNYFPEFSGGDDVEHATKFIVWRYRQANTHRVNVYSHITTATDSDRIRTVLSAVRDNILDNALKESGII